MQSNITTISNSIQPKVPSIIETKNLPTFTFSRSTCESITADQKKNLLAQVKTTKDSITSFKSSVKDQQKLTHADNSFQFLNVV